MLKGSDFAAFGFIHLPFPNWNIQKFPIFQFLEKGQLSIFQNLEKADR